MNARTLLPLVLALALPAQTAPPRHGPAGADRTIAMCTADDLSLAVDSENGQFDGMSHSGTLVILRNTSPNTCRVNAIPRITLADATHDLPATADLPAARFMHPGPVVLPVAVAAGAELTATMRWVQGEVFTDNLCISPTRLTVKIGSSSQTIDFAAHLCGERKEGVHYELTRFAPDPVSPR